MSKIDSNYINQNNATKTIAKAPKRLFDKN